MSADRSTFAARRPLSDVVHLNSAAAGRPSAATLAAASGHAHREAETGAYVAAHEAQPVLERLHADLGGMLGVPAAGVALVESATAGLRSLLGAWPLPPGARVGVVASEWQPNVEHFLWHGLTPVRLATDGAGHLDLTELGRTLRDGAVDLVHLTQVASQRALVQPVVESAALCRAAGVPLWVDAAQAVGHVDVASGADAVYATGRKWLAGPRGVGLLAVREDRWDELRVLRPAMHDDGVSPSVAFLESGDAHVAGRVGLANAVREFLSDGPASVHERLAQVGRATSAALADVPGWSVVGDAAGAISALRPTAGQDVARTQARLLAEHRVLTTASQPARSPADMPEAWLRVSPHVDCTDAQLDALRTALVSLG